MSAALAATVSGLALLSGAVVLATGGRGRTALRVLLDLLIAAGLLQLGTGRSWTALAGAAAVIALRQLLWVSLSAGGSGLPPTMAGPLRVRRSRPTVSGKARNGR
ncbi:hypothetical protein [Micromonospora sp. CPCC 205556]|uniref:hypothetical protein n=1 Tax=Micromonospora sp. CPCC 205556 TaxID=3122398 RepID=UPI002FF33AB6